MIKLIVALGKDRLIGKGNSLPWHIPADLKNFKKHTTGHAVVMGEKTYESMGSRPLPNRHNIILTLDQNYDPHDESVEVVHTLEEVVNRYKDTCNTPDETLFVIGGAQIYKLFLPYVDEMVVSYIKGDYTGDIYFPPFEEDFVKYSEDNSFDEFTVCYFKRKEKC